MAFPRPSKSAGELFDSLKDKLSNRSRDTQYEEEYQDDYYDDYDYENASDDYGPYSYEETYDSFRDSYRDRTPRARLENRYQSSAPHLVSSVDVRATTPMFNRESSSLGTSGSVHSHADATHDEFHHEAGFDVPVTGYQDFVSPYQRSQAQTQTTSTEKKSSGLDKLFTPTTSSSAGAAASSADPYAAYANNTQYSHLPTRGLTVIRPVKYQDVEGIAAAVKAGSVAVLVLRVTNDALAKRVLDFSFGVASALDARVDCVAEKVFVVARGEELTLEERHQLHRQGVL